MQRSGRLTAFEPKIRTLNECATRAESVRDKRKYQKPFPVHDHVRQLVDHGPKENDKGQLHGEDGRDGQRQVRVHKLLAMRNFVRKGRAQDEARCRQVNRTQGDAFEPVDGR